jgi:hypothetical protein
MTHQDTLPEGAMRPSAKAAARESDDPSRMADDCVGAMHPATKGTVSRSSAADNPSRMTGGDLGGASPLPHDSLPDGFEMTELDPAGGR